MKAVFFVLLSLMAVTANAQSLDGTYTGNEPRHYLVDDFGNIVFYPPSLYPWFFEVTVTIRGERLDIFKRYVYADSLARKHYADSLTNTYQYAAKAVKVQDRFLARSVLINKPAHYIYINGKYSKEANNYNLEVLRIVKEDRDQFQWYRYSDGQVWVQKQEIVQDLIIRQDVNGIWINNKFYKKVK